MLATWVWFSGDNRNRFGHSEIVKIIGKAMVGFRLAGFSWAFFVQLVSQKWRVKFHFSIGPEIGITRPAILGINWPLTKELKKKKLLQLWTLLDQPMQKKYSSIARKLTFIYHELNNSLVDHFMLHGPCCKDFIILGMVIICVIFSLPYDFTLRFPV